jgi:hypothetical protein
MKKIIISSILVFTLALAGCAAKNSSATNQDTTIQTDQLSTELELVVGTFKLDGTDNAVTTEQAEQLVTLWQAYQSLGISDTTASEELAALVKQIQSTMTTAQKDAITAMNLTNADMATLMQEKGLMNFPGGNGIVIGTPDPNQIPEAFVPGEGMPSGESAGRGNFTPPTGGGPGNGGGMPQGGVVIMGGEGPGQGMASNMTAEQLATAQANRGNRSQQSGMIPTALLNALIEYLQTK